MKPITLIQLSTALPESARRKLTLAEIEETVRNINSGNPPEEEKSEERVTLEEIEAAETKLEARVKEQLRSDGYLSDDPDGSGKRHSEQEWLAIEREKNRILNLKLTHAKQNPS